MRPKGMLLASFVLLAAMAYAQTYPQSRPYDQRPYDQQRNDRYNRQYYYEDEYVTGGVVPSGTEIRVRTDQTIRSSPSPNTRFPATVSRDVLNDMGDVVIPP